jgi:hypothetical protein
MARSTSFRTPHVRPPPDTKRAANDEPGRGRVVRRSKLGGLLNDLVCRGLQDGEAASYALRRR